MDGAPPAATHQSNRETHRQPSTIIRTEPLALCVFVANLELLWRRIPLPPALVVEAHEFVKFRRAMNPGNAVVVSVRDPRGDAMEAC